VLCVPERGAGKVDDEKKDGVNSVLSHYEQAFMHMRGIEKILLTDATTTILTHCAHGAEFEELFFLDNNRVSGSPPGYLLVSVLILQFTRSSHLPNPKGLSALASAPPVASFCASAPLSTGILSIAVGIMPVCKRTVLSIRHGDPLALWWKHVRS
jgi:hypothetical protein